MVYTANNKKTGTATDAKTGTELATAEPKTVVKKERNYTDKYHRRFGYDGAEPGEVGRYVRFAMESLNLPPIDISDPEQVRNRCIEYLTSCAERDIKPTVVGLSNWLGVSRDTLNEWKRGVTRKGTHSDLIEKIYGVLEEISTSFLLDGKTIPAGVIFGLKNWFGYRDQQEVVLTPNNPLGDAAGQKQLADKYLDLVDVGED